MRPKQTLSFLKLFIGHIAGVAALLGGLFLGLPAWAFPLPVGVTQGPNVESFTEYRLANGLKVLLYPDPAKPVVTVNVTYLVGSRHENYGETGMAHLLEHLLFKGSTNFPSLTSDFSARGMRVNGTTSLDRTNYYESFQASNDNLQWALRMEADRMVNSFVAQKDLDTEMSVVRNEYERGENTPFNVLFKRMQSLAFDWHNYGNSTIGNRSDIENVKIDNLKGFYRTYYQPDNAVLLVSGAFDAEQTLGWINASFGAIPKPTRTLPVQWTLEPTQDGERSFYVRRQGDLQYVLVAYKGPSSLHPDMAPAQVVASVLTNNPSGRLYKQLVETNMATAVFPVRLNGYAPGLLMLGATVKKGDAIEPVAAAMVSAMEDFDKSPPTEEELERVKRNSANAFEKFLTDPERIGVSMSEYLALGDWRLFFYDRDRVAKLTLEQVMRAAKTYFRRDNRIMGYFIPEDAPRRADIPAAPDVQALLKDFNPSQDTSSSVVSEVFDPSPVNIDKRTTQSQIGGLAVALLPKKNKGQTVSLSLRLRWGDEKSLFGKQAVSAMTAGMVMAGTPKYSKAQLLDEMSKLKITGGVTSFETTRANLGAAIALAGYVLRNLSFPEKEFETLRQQTIAGLEASRNDPGAIASRALALQFNPYAKGDYRAAQTLDESIAAYNAVTLADVKAFYKQFFGASQGELAIVGDFDADAAAKQIAAAFTGWTSATPYVRMTPLYANVPAKRSRINTPDKESGTYLARLNVPISDEHPDYPALLLANYIFGGGSGMSSRLMERVRQKDGLSYGVGSQLSINSLDRAGRFTISATAAPQNMAKVEAAIEQEIERATKQGFTPEEITKAQSGLRQQRLQSRTRDANLAGAWTQNLYLKRTFKRSQELDEALDKLNAPEVNAAFARHIRLAELSVVSALDAVKAATSASPSAASSK
jgi:zinc protease